MGLEKDRQTRADYRAGMIASQVVNAIPFREGKALYPWDLFGSLEAPPVREQTPQEMMEIMAAFRARRRAGGHDA